MQTQVATSIFSDPDTKARRHPSGLDSVLQTKRLTLKSHELSLRERMEFGQIGRENEISIVLLNSIRGTGTSSYMLGRIEQATIQERLHDFRRD